MASEGTRRRSLTDVDILALRYRRMAMVEELAVRLLLEMEETVFYVDCVIIEMIEFYQR